MESTVHTPKTETASVWTEEKHVDFLNTMEASFVRTILHRYGASNHHHHLLRLDRHVPDTCESTLDSKPRSRTKKHAPSDSMGSRARRMRRRSSQLMNSSSEQVVPQLEHGREDASAGDDDNEQRSNA